MPIKCDSIFFSYQAFLVAQDFGAIVAYLVALVYPEKVIGVVTLGVPFMLPGSSALQNHLLPDGFYINRWQVHIPYFSIITTITNFNSFLVFIVAC